MQKLKTSQKQVYLSFRRSTTSSGIENIQSYNFFTTIRFERSSENLVSSDSHLIIVQKLNLIKVVCSLKVGSISAIVWSRHATHSLPKLEQFDDKYLLQNQVTLNQCFQNVQKASAFFKFGLFSQTNHLCGERQASTKQDLTAGKIAVNRTNLSYLT